MAIYYNSKIEFDFTVRRSRDKNKKDYSDFNENKKPPEYEVVEELNFKSLSAVEVLRKLLDYLSG